MDFLKINHAACKGDGLCVAECPMRLLQLKAGSPVPTAVPGAESRCLKCGHCVAVCPYQALALADMKPEDCLPAKPDRVLDSETAEYFLRSRRSIRAYQNQKVEPEKVSKLLGMARYAPTAGNSQMVQWLVINSPAGVQKIASHVIDMLRYLKKDNSPLSQAYPIDSLIQAWEAGIDAITLNAPMLIVAHAPQAYAFAGVDVASALTYLDLAAPTQGLGTCWAGFVMLALAQWQPLQASLALPGGRVGLGAMLLGYPKRKYHRLPARKPAGVIWRE